MRRPRAVGRATLGLAALLVGCATPPAPPPPVIGGLPAGEPTQLVEGWEREWEAFSGLRAAIDLRVARDGRTERSAAVLLLSPTHLRLEVVAALGLPTMVLTAGPERITVLDAARSEAWSASATPDAMGRWLGMPLASEMLIRLLRGRAPLPLGDGAVRVGQEDGPHLAYDRGAVRQQIWVTPDGRPARVRVDDGEPLTATFWWTVSGELQGVSLDMPRRAVAAYLRYISAEYVVPPPEAFDLRIPDGIPVHRVD